MDTYYNPEDLAKFGTIGEKAPELAEKFFSYYNAVFEEGALTAREKSLIALAVAHTVQCPYCIDAYTNDCLNKGVTEEQMTKAVAVAVAVAVENVGLEEVTMNEPEEMTCASM